VRRTSSHTNSALWRRHDDGSWNGLLFAALGRSHQLEAETDRALAVVPLSARGFVALFEIARLPPATQRDLAARLGLRPSATSELLKRLRRRGLVRPAARRCRPRPLAQADAGRAAVALTEAGRTRLDRAVGIIAQLEDAWSARLDRLPNTSVRRLRASALAYRLMESRRAIAAEDGGDGGPEPSPRDDDTDFED